ncbi:LacI family DNA-binding transcriptional regulator [Nesterenkonia halotolerans]|uniref:LacI family DNA-binding transcriptional regulator n=1 Tax=Nesterenkonia halotolerans TaxID=225325 RepID=UPI003EE5C4D4
MSRPQRRTGPSLTQVASQAGVSIGTVSHVLNHPDRVRPATRERVLDAIEQLGFIPNSNASSLAGRENRTVGFVAIDIGNSLFVDMAQGAQLRAQREGLILQVGHSDNDEELQERHLDAFNSARVAGILLAPMQDPREAMARVRTLGTPVVVLNYDWTENDHCSVLIDNEKAGYLAVQHMLSRGHRHLAFVAGKDEYQPVRDRRRGVHRAVAEHGGVTLTEIHVEDLNAAGGVAAGERLLNLPAAVRPDGVIAVTDMLGMAIIQKVAAGGLNVPADLAVMGCDYNVNAWGGSVPLTSVRMHGESMGEAAVELLLEEIRGADHEHRRIVLEPSLVVRQSTGG